MHHPAVRMAASLLAASAVCFECALGQRTNSLTLQTKSTLHPDEFTSIRSARELADGTVLVSDGRERRLMALRFDGIPSTQIGREGKGPGEYIWVGKMFATVGDSTILADGANGRWTVLDGVRFSEHMPADHPLVKAWGSVLSGAARTGQLLLLPRSWATLPANRRLTPDSSPVILAERRSGRAQVVAQLRRQPMRLEGSDERRGSVGGVDEVPVGTVHGLPEDEGAVLFADGWLAVARVRPFRVDFRAPNGLWRRGTALPVARIPVTRREREAYLERTAGNYTSAFGLAKPDASAFPEFIPPFVFPEQSLLAASDGSLLIKRTRSADNRGNAYYVIDRSSRLRGELALPPSQAIVGFGSGHVYIAETNADDIVQLRRAPWPPVSTP